LELVIEHLVCQLMILIVEDFQFLKPVPLKHYPLEQEQAFKPEKRVNGVVQDCLINNQIKPPKSVVNPLLFLKSSH